MCRKLVLLLTVRTAMGMGRRNGTVERNPTTFRSLLPPLGVTSLQELNCLELSKSKPKLFGSGGVSTASLEHQRLLGLIGMKPENQKGP